MSLLLTLALACSTPAPDAPADAPATAPTATANPAPPPGQHGQPGNHGQPNKPTNPPPGGEQGMQDPSGFPKFHDMPAPDGPEPGPVGAFSEPFQLTAKPTGGYRPQIAVGPDDTLHAVYYDRTDDGDVVRYRQSKGGEWTAPEAVSPLTGRNWGPDLVTLDDGGLVLTWDHAAPDFSSQGWFRERSPGGAWGEALRMTPESDYEVGSTHVATAGDGELAYVYIGRTFGDFSRPFVAYWRWRKGDTWTEPVAFSDGSASAWHTNVESRPDGSVAAGWDEGPGGSSTVVFVASGKDGAFDAPENLSRNAKQGERPHWAFIEGGGDIEGIEDHVVYFHRGQQSRPLAVYHRAGKPGAWGPVNTPSEGLGGYHFDPEIAVSEDGTLCMVWGWDAGEKAELLYSLNTGDGWSAPLRVAEIGWGKPGLPSIDIDSAGTFHVVWNQGVRGYNEVYYATLKL